MAETLVRLLPVSAGVLWLTAPFVFPLILLGYFAATEGSALAASLGKRLYGLRVRLKDGRRLGYRSAFIRALAFYLTVTLLTPLILVLVPMTRGRRALHDVFVGGMVVDNLAAVRRS